MQASKTEPSFGLAHADYPRACGVASRRGGAVITTEGLSLHVRGGYVEDVNRKPVQRFIPHVRGDSGPVGCVWGTRRFIPACAGLLQSAQPSRPVTTAYPACAGLLRLKELRSAYVWVYPACAGLFPCFSVKYEPFKDYPRACGVVLVDGVRRSPVQGLSPRVRGGSRRACPCVRCCRFIPACAG